MFSVSIHDCKVDTFRSGGPGGQNQNKRDTGVRVTHPPSGAVGRSTDTRKQHDNKVDAFKKMVATKEFMAWVKIQAGVVESIDEAVHRSMDPRNVKVEVLQDGRWIPEGEARAE